MPLLFAVTMFVSASLLFMVQPMVAKAVLPLLGGSPAVWNGCMVFFQALLLLGYLYADRLTRHTDTRKQWMIHLGVLTLPVAAFVLAAIFSAKHTPIAVVEALAPTDGESPILSVLLILTVAIGVPFFVCSTTATLLQKWFTYTGHPSARDPYFLYAASNFGSLISLLGYPFFVEPNLTQGGQTWVWAFGFAALAGLIVFCGKAAVNPLGVPPGAKAKPAAPALTGGEKGVVPPPGEPPATWARMAKWTALAFVPSSLMLGVTFHMTTDIASIPLLWVGPLALYLVTFIIAFSHIPPGFRILIGNLAPVMILLLVFLLISGVSPGIGLTLLLHLLTFFAAALMCHYELARDRPSPQYLTTYFLIMSFGGVLGGIFNSLLAPLIFNQEYEYKLVLVVACLMVPRLSAGEPGEPTEEPSRRRRRLALALDLVLPVLVGLAFWRLQKIGSVETYARAVGSVAKRLTISVQTIHVVLVYALPVMVCFFFVDRPLRFALCVAAILGITVFREESNDDVRTVYTERSFFGILKVEQRGQFTRLVHGTTLHGTQINETFTPHWRDDLQRLTAINPLDNVVVAGMHRSFNPREEPLTYYHRSGPVGAMFHEIATRDGGRDAKAHMAMVGLGTGSVSCYAQKGQKLTFYEIDPAVRRIVETPWKVMNPKEVEAGAVPVMGPFTYVSDARARGADIDFKMGDARLKMKDDPADLKYTLLLVDAFSSDSIPVHLLTVEAVGLYLKHLTGDGILALHISNKFVRLEPVVAAIAAEHGLAARVWNDDAEGHPGKTASSWVALARKPEHLGPKIGSWLGDVVGTYGPEEQLADIIKSLYPAAPFGITSEPPADQLVRVLAELHPDLPAPAAEAPQKKEAVLTWLDARRGDPQARAYAVLLRKLAPAAAPALQVPQAQQQRSLMELLRELYPEVVPVLEEARLKNAENSATPNLQATLVSWLDARTADDHARRAAALVRRYSAFATVQQVALDQALLAWLAARTDDLQAQRYAAVIRNRTVFPTAMAALQAETGYGFRPVRTLPGVDAWTDDYADVMRVMMIPELQAVRGFFGLPTPVKR